MKKKLLLCLLGIVVTMLNSLSYNEKVLTTEVVFNANENGYDVVDIEGYKKIDNVGCPELPVKYVNLIIPPSMSVKNLNITKTSETLKSDFLINPVQNTTMTIDDDSVSNIELNKEIYDSNTVYPLKVAEVVRHGYFDGANRIVTIALYPIQYKPLTKKIVINNSIDIEFDFEESSDFIIYPKKQSVEYYNSQTDILEQIVENDSDIEQYRYTPRLDDSYNVEYNIAVIVNRDYGHSYTIFKNFMKDMGYNINIYFIDDIIASYPEGDDINPEGLPINPYSGEGSIRKFLYEKYLNEGLTHALITTNNYMFLTPKDADPTSRSWSDLYFSDFNGSYKVDNDDLFGEEHQDSPDIFQEISIGRLMLPIDEDLGGERTRIWVDKFITYCYNPGFGDTDYLKKSFYEAADEPAYFSTNGMINDQLDILEDNDFYVELMIEDPIDGPLGGPTAQQVIDAVSSGYGLINFYCHSDAEKLLVATTGLGEEPSYKIHSTNVLHDNNKEAVIFCLGANTLGISGNYPNIGFAQSYTTHQMWGGPAFIGNSNDEGKYHHCTLYTDFLEKLFFNGGYNENNRGGIGSIHSAAKVTCGDYYSLVVNNLVGCPTMSIWTDTPKEINVEYIEGTNSIYVSSEGLPLNNAKVNFFIPNSNDVLRTTTNDAGMAFCSSEFEKISIRKLNYLPYIEYIAIDNGYLSTDNAFFLQYSMEYNLRIKSGNTFTIDHDINLSAKAKKCARIIVEKNATLNIDDNVMIKGNMGNSVDVYGDINIGQNVNFGDEPSSRKWDGLNLYNNDNTIIDNVKFFRCNLVIDNVESVSINNSEFVEGNIICRNSHFSISNSSITDADCGINCFSSPFVEVNDTNIQNSISGINIRSCPMYKIDNISISNCMKNGIEAFKSGNDLCRGSYIKNSNISNNRQTGINFYDSYCLVESNIIENNRNGIVCSRESNICVRKNKNTDDWSNNSVIRNNLEAEITYTENCFLDLYRGKNKIVDNDYTVGTNDQYLIYCPNITQNRNFSGNLWGYCDCNGIVTVPPNERFNYSENNNLNYILTPLWNPSMVLNNENNEAYDLYNEAVCLQEQGSYDIAKQRYEEVIDLYPYTNVCLASARRLISVSENYNVLKDYFNNEENLHLTNSLNKYSDYLSNYCDVINGNYDDAITFFENIINNSEDVCQTVMAEIELLYISFLKENENRDKDDIYSNQYTYNSFVSKLNDKLTELDEVFYQQSNENIIDENQVEKMTNLYDNYPNPFNPTTTIQFDVSKEMIVDLSIYNLRGQKIKTLLSKKMNEGTYSAVWNGTNDCNENVSSGIYFYKLHTNDGTVMKKMVLLK